MDEQPTKLAQLPSIDMAPQPTSLKEENDRLKAHIIILEAKISELEDAAIHILKSCTSTKS